MKYHYKTGLIVPFAQKYYKQLIVVIAAIFMATFAALGLNANAAPNWTANAGSMIDFSCGGGSYQHTLLSVNQDVSGNLTGTGRYNPDNSYTWNLTGSITDDTFTASIEYTGTGAGSIYNLAGTVASDGSASGAVDSNCQTFTMPADSFSAFVAPPTVQPCEEVSVLHTTDLTTWNLSATSSDGSGHNELALNGLHVWTDASGHRKAAGYYATDFPLSGLGDQSIADALDWTAAPGNLEPGLQVVTDFDNNGTPDGILVGESVYGNVWWVPDSAGTAQFVKDGAPSNSGGFGSQYNGTINQWLSVFPNAQVLAIGYSLGSGVTSDGVIERISLGCVDYTFGLPPVVTKFQVKPWVYDPGKTRSSESAWKTREGLADAGKSNHALFLSKNALTTANVASGATVNYSGRLDSLGFDYRNDGHCGAGAPRFNVYTTNGTYYFFGCNHGTQTPSTESADWTRVTFENGDAFPANGVTAWPGFGVAQVTGLELVFDEGTEVGEGFVYLDNIQVNGVYAGKPGLAQ